MYSDADQWDFPSPFADPHILGSGGPGATTGIRRAALGEAPLALCIRSQEWVATLIPPASFWSSWSPFFGD